MSPNPVITQANTDPTKPRPFHVREVRIRIPVSSWQFILAAAAKSKIESSQFLARMVDLGIQAYTIEELRQAAVEAEEKASAEAAAKVVENLVAQDEEMTRMAETVESARMAEAAE